MFFYRVVYFMIKVDDIFVGVMDFAGLFCLILLFLVFFVLFFCYHARSRMRFLLCTTLLAVGTSSVLGQQLETTTVAPQHNCGQYEKALACNDATEQGEKACAWDSTAGGCIAYDACRFALPPSNK